jgi:hypothetical protein
MPDGRLEVSVTFDERGYIGSAPELRSPVMALSLGGLRRKVETLLLPDDVRVVLHLDGLAERERHRRQAKAQRSRIAQLDQRTALPDQMSALGGSGREPLPLSGCAAPSPVPVFTDLHVEAKGTASGVVIRWDAGRRGRDTRMTREQLFAAPRRVVRAEGRLDRGKAAVSAAADAGDGNRAAMFGTA